MQRYDFYLGQLVTEANMDDAYGGAEQADWDMMADFGLVGICSGLVAVQHSPTADLTVDVSAGPAYDANGQRMEVGSTQTIDLSVDFNTNSTAVATPGNSKVISLFIYADRLLSDPQTDDNSNIVQYSRAETFAFKVVQGTEATTGTETAPALESDKILICDVTIVNAHTQILDAEINANAVGNNRRQDAFDLTAGVFDIREGQPESALGAMLTHFNGHVTGVSGAHAATAISYAGGSNWADGETNPATTAGAQISKSISDLAAVAGGARIGAAAHTAAGAGLIDLTAGSVTTQLIELSDDAASHSLDQVVAGSWDFSATTTELTADGALLAWKSVTTDEKQFGATVAASDRGSDFRWLGHDGGAGDSGGDCIIQPGKEGGIGAAQISGKVILDLDRHTGEQERIVIAPSATNQIALSTTETLPGGVTIPDDCQVSLEAIVHIADDGSATVGCYRIAQLGKGISGTESLVGSAVTVWSSVANLTNAPTTIDFVVVGDEFRVQVQTAAGGAVNAWAVITATIWEQSAAMDDGN